MNRVNAIRTIANWHISDPVGRSEPSPDTSRKTLA